MSKEKEVVDLQPKIKEEQLKELQELVGKIQSGQSTLGQLETQKFNVLQAISALQVQLKDFQNKLEEEYGNVSISIADGTIKEIEDEADQKD